MIQTLEIQLLGGFSVQLNGQPIHAFRTSKTRALLAYLAVEANREHSRATLATLFWGEVSDAMAKTNLRSELANLKSLLAAHPALEVARTHVYFRSDLAATDVYIFQKSINRFLSLPNEARNKELAKLVAAIDLYQGEFLAGLDIKDAAAFEDWQLLTREHLHEQLMSAHRMLQAGYAEQGWWLELADASRRQLAIVAWTESAHRNLMQALAAQGQVQAALIQFEKCRAILQKELGSEPSLATVELAARLREGAALAPAVQHNLRRQLKTFVGRKGEIERLQALVKSEKLVTVLGVGGVGKSHLAQAVAQTVLHSFADGVWFVPLENIEAGAAATERIALAIAAAIGFQVTNMQAPLSELMTYLTTRRMLLVLDNWEHLIESAATVLDQLRANHSIHILATSRAPLRIQGEIIIQLEGLPTEEAHTLFMDRARHISAGDTVRICQQVGGLPLEIELAAGWVKHHSVAEIGQSIAKLAIAPQPRDGFVTRDHLSTRVLEYSWRLLSAHHQQILSKLSVFRGGFNRAAAAAVTESKFSDLSALISHSLVQHVAVDRYDLHPLIQEFSAEKLVSSEAAALYAKYSQHYLMTLINTERSDWASRLRLDFENIRSAWQRAVHARSALLIQPAVTPFGDYMAQFGLIPDGERLFQEAAASFDGVDAHRELVAQLLEQQSSFTHSLHGLKAAGLLQQRMLILTNRRELRIKTHINLAFYYAEIGDWKQADAHFNSTNELVDESSDIGLYIRVTESRIRINALHFRGDFIKGIARLEEMLVLLKAAPEQIADAETLHQTVLRTLSSVAIRYGDYATAIRYSHECLALLTELGPQRAREQVLGMLALGEEYAGLFTEAINHHQEAIALAMEIGDTENIGTLKVNFCLTLLQSGELEQALIYGLEATEILSTLGHKRIEGQARNRVGHILLALERWADAYVAYGDALAVWAIMQHSNRHEALAGRAVAALRLGKHAEALALIEEVLSFTANKGLTGIVEPVRLLLNCEVVLTGVGETERAHNVLLQAGDWVQTIAGHISDDVVRDAFLHNRPDNQRLKARIAAFSASPTPNRA